MIEVFEVLVPPASPLPDRRSVGAGAWAAAGLICLGTLGGAWLVRRFRARRGLWPAIAATAMLALALADIVPEVWAGAREAGVALWWCGVAGCAGFLVVAHVTRRCCGPAGIAPGAAGGAAGVIAVHRVVEGAPLGLVPSVPLVVGLVLHAVGEGLALAVLLGAEPDRLRLWLPVAALSPAVGLLLTSVSPVPETVVPVVLAVVAGVLLRMAWVGAALAVAERRTTADGAQDGAADTSMAV